MKGKRWGIHESNELIGETDVALVNLNHSQSFDLDLSGASACGHPRKIDQMIK
jgi:hypothetical protein